jgi:hypothetical protein
VERALSWLASPAPRAELPDAIDLEPFQLDEPNYRVEITLRDGRTLGFLVGREAPTGGSRYVSLAGRAGVLVVSSFGLDEVLTLQRDLLPTPTPSPEPSATELSGTVIPESGGTSTPPSGTVLPTLSLTEAASPGPSLTPTPEATP